MRESLVRREIPDEFVNWLRAALDCCETVKEIDRLVEQEQAQIELLPETWRKGVDDMIAAAIWCKGGE